MIIIIFDACAAEVCYLEMYDDQSPLAVSSFNVLNVTCSGDAVFDNGLAFSSAECSSRGVWDRNVTCRGKIVSLKSSNVIILLHKYSITL